MRDIRIQKLNDRHYAVYIDGELVYEGINKKSCTRYLKSKKNLYLRMRSEELVGLSRGS